MKDFKASITNAPVQNTRYKYKYSTSLLCYKGVAFNQNLIGGRLKQVNCNILYLIKPLVVFDYAYPAAECILCLSVPGCVCPYLAG